METISGKSKGWKNFFQPLEIGAVVDIVSALNPFD